MNERMAWNDLFQQFNRPILEHGDDLHCALIVGPTECDYVTGNSRARFLFVRVKASSSSMRRAS
jgi:hypothetical protein